MKKLTLTEQEQLFAKDCRLINLRYEYRGYTGTEKWAVVTELTEEELWEKYPDIIRRYLPFIRLSMAQGEVITDYQNHEAKVRMRKLRYGHMYDINDDFEEHHPETVSEEDIIEEIIRKEEAENVQNAIHLLTETQKRRVVKYFFDEMTYREIAAEEGVNVSKIKNSITASLKKLKNYLQ